MDALDLDTPALYVDLDVLERKAVEIKQVLDKTPGFTELTVVREGRSRTVAVGIVDIAS